MSEHLADHRGEPGYGSAYSSAPPQTYDHPLAHGRPQIYRQRTSTTPYSHGPPVSAVPQQRGATLQPHSTAAAPATYAQAFALTQVARYPLVSVGGRIGAALLDVLLMLVTLWIGWLVWAMVTWSDGQSPAKQLLGYVVADADTGEPFDWGRMALREFCVKGLLGWLLSLVSLGIYVWVDAFMILGDRQRTLHDRMANSIVRHV
jgi:uncharacterized RDD family membrane protein YckC